MAYFLRIKNRNLGSFSVTSAVGRSKNGRRAPNDSADVMLVQWLLPRLLRTEQCMGPPLTIDGDYGPQTDSSVSLFTYLDIWLLHNPGGDCKQLWSTNSTASSDRSFPTAT